jgi:hypothetical protein
MPEDGRDTGIIGPVASAAFPICAANRGVCVCGVFVHHVGDCEQIWTRQGGEMAEG